MIEDIKRERDFDTKGGRKNLIEKMMRILQEKVLKKSENFF